VSQATPTRESGANPIMAMLGPEFFADPYPFYAMLRRNGPMTWLPDLFGLGTWLVTGYGVGSSALRNKQLGREAERVLPPEKLVRFPVENADLIERRKGNMLFADPPTHTRLRGLVSQAFTPRTIERLRGHVAAIAEHLLDEAEAKVKMDLIRDFAFPLPVTVIAELLGVPPSDRDMFKAWSSDLIAGLSPQVTAEQLGKVRTALDHLDAYFTRVIEDRHRAPRADLISDLIRAQEAGDTLTTMEMVVTCRLLLVAGHETTVNLIGNGALALLRNPEELEALAADPKLLPGAIEELLRYDGTVQMTMRFAMEDTVLGDQAVKRGDAVMILLGAGNHDPAQFPEPGRLDIRRENAQSHLTLGGGIHYCLGAPLARLEGQIAIGALLRRLPRVKLATDRVKFRPNMAIRGVEELPVTF
jgi:pimeloyl-[acyl-carrier protein] synthase